MLSKLGIVFAMAMEPDWVAVLRRTTILRYGLHNVSDVKNIQSGTKKDDLSF
jgi:hypothetical protein